MIDQEKVIINKFQHLELLAHQIVEGFISGMHKSPFHGFSAEFAEHKIYNSGESTKHIDWKLFAKTDRLYTKQFEEETNLRCHLIIDNSASMHFPNLIALQNFFENKIGFSVLASAVLMNLLKKQRDAVGLSVYSDNYEYYSPEKGSERHHRMLLTKLESLLVQKPKTSTQTATYLHQIAEKIHRRSMIVLFTDMFHPFGNKEEDDRLFKALLHLKHKKNKVVLFHVYDGKKEIDLNFSNTPTKFVDLESGEDINVFPKNVKEAYQSKIRNYFQEIELNCSMYKIKYIPVSVQDSFEKIITTYLVEKQRFR